MRPPQLCCLLLAASWMLGMSLPAYAATELQDPESKDLSAHLFLREILGLGRPNRDTPGRSFRSTVPWQPPPPPRPRKPGCKSFYWKTLTSC